MIEAGALDGERSWRPVGVLAALAVGTVGPLIDAEFGGHWVGSPVDTIGVAVIGFLLGAWVRAAMAALGCLLGALALTVANQRVEAERYTFANDYFFFALVIGATALAGALIAGRRRQVRELRRLGALRQRQQADELATAELVERLRLETEVTQAAMQRMSALVVQAAGARLLPPGDPVRTAAGAMEEAARAVAIELRETVGSLRAPIEDGIPAPTGSGHTPDLVPVPPTPTPARLRWPDVVIAASGLPVAFELLTGADVRGPLVANLVMAAVLGVPLLWRRTRPLLSVTGLLVIAVTMSLTLTPLGGTASILLPVSLVAFAVGAYCRGRARLAGIVVLALGAGAVEAIGRPTSLGPAEVVPSVVWLVVAVLSGVVAARQAGRAADLRELLDLTESGRESRLRLALAEQRQAVARDLHDGLALAVTVITVQSQVVRRSDDPAQVSSSLGTIEESARDAMTQLRIGLATLETDERPSDLEAELGAFAAWLGLRLRTRLDPVPDADRPLARRVIRESLINIARHAPGAQVEVAIVREHDQLVVEVTDSGAAGTTDSGRNAGAAPTGSAGASGVGTGTGLLGLAEVVREHGGRLEQGPLPVGGFRVAARWPLPSAAVSTRRLRTGSFG